MDEDEWLASIDLESLERGIQQQQRPGKTVPVVATADQQVQARCNDQQYQIVQMHATCKAGNAQQPAQHKSEHKSSLHAMTAADLLKGTLSNHPTRQAADMPHHQGAMPLRQLQQWPGQHQKHPQTGRHACSFDPSSNTLGANGVAYHQLSNNQQHTAKLSQTFVGHKLGPSASQQHWPDDFGTSLPQPHQQQQLHSQHVAGISDQQRHQTHWQQQNWQQQQWTNHNQVHQPQHGWQQQQQPTRGPVYFEQQQSHQHQQLHQQQSHQHPPAYPYQSNHAHEAQTAHQAADDIVPRCPYRVCPGVFNFCGAELCYRKRKDGSSGFWSCSTWPGCDFKYFPAQQVPRPELGCEIVDEETFRLAPQPAAEVAVAKAGGIRAVLAAAGVTLDHLEVKQPAVIPELDLGAADMKATADKHIGQQQQQEQHQRRKPTAETAAVDPAEPTVAQQAAKRNAAGAAESTAAAVPDFSWSPEDSMLLRLVDYELVVALLNTAKPPLLGKGGAIPPQTLEAFRSPDEGLATTEEVEMRYNCMPLSLQQALLPFQQAGVKFGLGRHGRVLIADEMGVGKTVQALALAACYQDEWPLLVVVPASLRLVWAEEIERWLPHVRPGEVTVIEGREDRLCDLPDANARRREKLPAITITSYEMLKRLSCAACQKLPTGPAGSGGGRGRGGGRGSGKTRQCCTGPDHCMAALPWGVVIVDESHNLRTTNSRQADSPHTEAAVAAGSNAKHVILLSGTPSLSRPYDLYRQVDLLVPGLLGRTKEEFAHRYCDRRLVPVITSRGENRLRWNNAGGARLVELHGLLVRRVMIRRLKKDVMAQLPPKRRQVVRLPYPPANHWPKEQEPGAATAVQEKQQQQQQQQQQSNPQEPAEGASGAAGTHAGKEDASGSEEAAAAGVMSAAHRTALAKLPDAIDWLLAALGESSGSTASSGAPAATAAARSSRAQAPSGPLKPAWKKDTGNSSGSSACGSSAAATAVKHEDVDVVDDEEDGSGGSSSSAAAGGSSGPKFLVFAHHRDVMDKLAAALSGFSSSSRSADPDEVEEPPAGSSSSRQPHGVGYVRVDGSHDSTERLTAVQRFRSDPTIRVALLSITAAAVGLDFSSASMVVFVELPTEVSLVRQAEDRAHRKGQCKAVNVYFLCAQGTVDDKRWQALNISLSHVSQVHDGQAETLPEPLARPADADTEADTAEEQQQQQVEGVGKQQQGDQDAGSYDQQQQQPQDQEQVAAAKQEPAAEAASNEGPALCTPLKSTAAAHGGGGGGGEADTSAAELVDLTAESPAAPNSSSRKRKRQPLDLSPAATKSPAAAAAALAAAARTPVPSCRKQAQQRTPPAVNKSVITAAEAAGDGSSAVPVVVPDVWFEVSGHTNRLHYHLHPDGSKPLGMNLPLHWLMMPEEQGSLRQMAAAWDNAQQQLKVKQEELQQRQVLSRQQKQKQQESRASQQPQQQPQAQCTQLGFLGQQSQQQAAVDQDVIQQQQCFLSPTVQQKVLHSLQGVQLQSQQQQQHQPNLAAAPLSAAAGGGGSSRGTGRGAARPALSSLVLLPFTSPTATPTAAVSKTPDGHMAATSQQQQQQQQAASGSNDSRSPTVVCSSPALSQRIRRLLHQQDMQQPPQQQGDHVLGAQADVEPAAVISEQYRDVSLPVDADVIAETPDSHQQQQQPGRGDSNSAPQLLLLDSQDDIRQQQQDGFIVVHSSGQQQQQQEKQTLPDDVFHQSQEQQETDTATAAAVQSLPDCHRAAGFFGPSGLTCLTLQLTQPQLLELLRLGAAFASDWSELRSVTRNRLAGKVVPPDLTAAVEAVSAAAAGSGAFGVGVVRYMKDIQEGDPNLPQGAWLETVTVHYPQGRQPVVKYRQAFTGPTTRHCINCFKAVEGAVLPADAVLMGGLDLFCSAECERAYYIKNSSSGIRRALFKLERGLCVVCGVDGHNLVKQLQQIGKDEPNWAATRRCIVAQHAPRFLERGYATYLDKLINQATEGNAWHADHIVPVYAGGGGCDLDNLRTLCVPCHAGVTRQQARERAEERQRRKLGTRDIRHWFGGTAAAAAAAAAQGDNQGLASKKALKPNHVMKRKRRAAVEAVFVDDALSPEINTAVNRKTAGKVTTAAAAAAVGGESLNADVVTDEGDDELERALRESLLQQQQQQQQQQQHYSVDIISIISSPSCDTQPPAAAAAVTVPGGGGGGGEQQQPFSAMVSTPTSAVRSSQDLRRTEQKTVASVVPSPPAARRAAAAAAKGAAAVAGSKEGARGVLSVLDQFKYIGRLSQQDDAQQLSHRKRQDERPGELAIADSSDIDSAEAVAACVADAAAAGQAVHCHSSSSRRAARAAAAAINKQLGGLGCGSSDDDEERGSPLLEGSHCGQQQQEHAAAESVTGVLYLEQGSFATAAGACRSKRVVKATAAGSSKQPQQRKRARGGKRDRSVLDST